jgi:protein SCO1/2
MLTAAAARAEKTPIVFPQGSEQPLAALQDIDVIEHLGDRVGAGLAFTDAASNPVRLESLLHQGKPVLVTLGYHRCPMLCGLVLDGLVKAARTSGLKLGKDFFAVDVSIDPAEDAQLLAQTQKRVLALAGSTNTADWPFWTSVSDGGAAARKLAEAVGFRYKYDSTSKQFAHDAVAFVLTPEGVVARYLYGVDYPARDFRMAIVEASGGRVGTSFDKVLMSCYRYDPAKRRYAPFVMGFMRIGAGTMALALVGLLAVLWRKELVMKQRQIAMGLRADGRTA